MSKRLEVHVVVAVPVTIDDEGNATVNADGMYVCDENPFMGGGEEVWDEDAGLWRSVTSIANEYGWPDYDNPLWDAYDAVTAKTQLPLVEVDKAKTGAA